MGIWDKIKNYFKNKDEEENQEEVVQKLEKEYHYE